MGEESAVGVLSLGWCDGGGGDDDGGWDGMF